MDCTDVRGILAELVEEALPEKAAQQAQAHLVACSQCQSAFEQLRKVDAVLASWSPPEPPADLWEGVKSRIESGSGGAGGGIAAPVSVSLVGLLAAWKFLLLVLGVFIGGYALYSQLNRPVIFDNPPRFQNSLIQSHRLQQMPNPLVDPVRSSQPAIEREKGGTGLCH